MACRNMKQLFETYQPELVNLANRNDGRKFLGIDHEVKSREWISRVFPNGYSIQIGRKKQRSVFRCYPLIARKLQAVISQVEITRNEKLYQKLGKYKGLLHYSGLFRQPRLFPQIFLTDSTFYSEVGDGRVYSVESAGSVSQTVWNNNHDAATGTADHVGVLYVGLGSRLSGGNYDWRFFRGYIPFITSDLPDAEEISIATVQLYVNSTSNAWNDAKDYFTILETTQAATNELVTGDYDAWDSVDNPTKRSDDIDIGSLNTGAYNVWTLIDPDDWISKVGNTLLGTREGHDQEDSKPSDPPDDTWIYNNMSCSASEEGGTSEDPKLIVTHGVAEVISPLLNTNQPIFLKPKMVSY